MKFPLKTVLYVATVSAGCLWFSDAPAQGVRVFGTARDGASGDPINGAEVLLVPEGDGDRAFATTRGAGSYLLRLPRGGSWRLAATVQGKVLASVELKIKSDGAGEAVATVLTAVPGEPVLVEVPEGGEVQCDLVLDDPRFAAEAALVPLTQQIQKGDCAGALPGLEKLVAAAPDLAKTHYLLGFCRAGAGQDAEAVASLGRTLELQPKFPGAALLQGQVLTRMGKGAEAEAAFRREIEAGGQPQLATTAWMGLAALQRDAGKPADASVSLEEAIKLSPSRMDAYAELAASRLAAGQPDEAVAAVDRAEAAGLSVGRPAIDLGILFFKAKDYSRSEKMIRKAIDAGAPRKDLAIAHGILGQLDLRAGKTAEAKAAFQKSVELDPDGPVAEEAKKALKSLGK